MTNDQAADILIKLWGKDSYFSFVDNVFYLSNEAGPEEGIGASWEEAFACLYHNFPNTKRV